MMNRHECQHLLGQLSDYVDGELEQTMCEEIERHLADCQNCRVVVDTLSKTVALYRTQGQDPAARRRRGKAVQGSQFGEPHQS